MQARFEELRNREDFRAEVFVFLQVLLQISSINYSAIRLDPHPYRLFKKNEIPLKFGDLSFMCEIISDGIYSFR